jgi:uncharacterized membrane protein
MLILEPAAIETSWREIKLIIKPAEFIALCPKSLILIGLSVAVLLLLAGFGLNFFNGSGSLSLESLQEHALKPDVLIDAIKNNQMPASLIISYTGLLVIILVPAAGLIYILGYFTHRKKYYLALTAAGVLFILILSAVIGLLKS